jgi:CheY-like chemotaxis protein
MTVPYGPLLVVEDVPHILQLLEMTLKFKGYPVVTAQNGEEALAKITAERPALVVTDILMPKLDGFALIQRLRTDPKTNTIPIIFLSATYITPEDKAFAMRLGAARFLEKPVDTEEFLLTVAEVLTGGPETLPPPMRQEDFNLGYRERLEQKLRHKAGQIARIERLLGSVPAEQITAFQALLDEARQTRHEIQQELDVIYDILKGSFS